MPDLAEAPEVTSISTTVERTRDARHGDFTTNIAMRLAKSLDAATAAISFQVNGGQGDNAQLPPTVGDVPTNSNGNQYNVQVLALRRVSDDTYLIHGSRSGNGTSYTALNFSNTDLVNAGVVTGEVYALDWIDSYSGGWGFAAVDDIAVTGAFQNLSSAIGNLDGDSVTVTTASTLYTLDAGGDATFSDPDAPANFDQAQLTVSFSVGADPAEDELGVGATMNVSDTVLIGGVGIGTVVTNGQSGSNLVIQLNTDATAARVQELIRSLTYRNTVGGNPLTRVVQVSLTEDNGPTSNVAEVTLNFSLGGAVDTFVWDGDSDADGDGVSFSDRFNFEGDPASGPDLNDIVIFRTNDPGSIDLGGGIVTVGEVQFDGTGSFTLENGTLRTDKITQTAAATGANVISASITSSVMNASISGTGSLRLVNPGASIAGGLWDVNVGSTLEVGVDGTNSALGNSDVNLDDGTLSVFASGLPTPDPGAIAGIEAWYDASTLAATLNDGDQVTAWADRSGNGRDLVTLNGVPTFETNEIGGNPAVRFNANDETLQMAVANDYFAKDVYLVFRAGNGDRTLFGPNWGAPIGVRDGDDADRTWMFQPNEDRFWGNELPSSVRRNSVDIASSNNFDMSAVAGNNAMGEYMVLRVVAGPNNGTQIRDYIIGTRTDAWGDSRSDIAEVIAFNTELGTADRDTVETYLSNKYGIGSVTVQADAPNSVTASGTSNIEVESGFTASLDNLTVAAGATVNIEGKASFATTVLGGNTTINLVNNAQVNLGAISETAAANLTFSGAGTVTMDSASTYTGTTTVQTGLQINAADGAAFGDASAGTTVDAGGTIDFVSGTYAEAFNISGNGFGTGDSQAEGALKSTGTATITGQITAAADARIYNTGDTLQINGGFNVNGNTVTLDAQNRIQLRTTSLSGGGLVRFEGNDRTDLVVNNNNYSGDFQLFNDGWADLHSGNAFGDHGATVTVLGSNATINLRNGRSHRANLVLEGDGRGTLGAIYNENNANTIDGTLTLTGATLLGVNATSLTITGAVTGPHTLTKTRAGKLILGSTANNFGLLDWTGGDLQVKNDTGFGTTANVVIEDGRTLEFNPDTDITSNQQVTFNGGTLSVLANEVTMATAVDVGLEKNVLVSGDGDLILSQSFGNGNTPVSFTDSLSHFGFHVNNDNAALRLHGNNGVMGGGTPASGIDPNSGTNLNFEGQGLLTDGPGGRGLDFDNDGDFRNIPAEINDGGNNGFVINQNDSLTNLFFGTLTVDAANAGTWRFDFVSDDGRQRCLPAQTLPIRADNPATRDVDGVDA